MSNIPVITAHLKHTIEEIYRQVSALLSGFKSVEIVMQDSSPNQRLEYLEKAMLSLLQSIKNFDQFQVDIGVKSQQSDENRSMKPTSAG